MCFSVLTSHFKDNMGIFIKIYLWQDGVGRKKERERKERRERRKNKTKRDNEIIPEITLNAKPVNQNSIFRENILNK